MSHISTPIIQKIMYSNDALLEIKESLDGGDSELIFDYPTIYIVNDEKSSHKYNIYIGETTDIVRRTREHLNGDTEDRDDWHEFANSPNTEMIVIGHQFFNKSLTLDIEDRLMLYLSSVDSVFRINNRRGNPQNKYYTSDKLNDIFNKIWRKLNGVNAVLFPAENIVRNSAIFKASPFHKLTKEQVKAKDLIITKLASSISRGQTGTLILVKGDAGSGKTVLMSSLVDELLNEGELQPIRENQSIHLIVNHEDQLSVYKEIEKKLDWHSGLDGVSVVMKPTSFINTIKKTGKKSGVVIVDEGHLLLTAKNQGYQGGNHLKDLLASTNVVVLVYDDKQIMSKSQMWTDDYLLEQEHEALQQGNYIELKNQMRIKANQDTVEWIRTIIDDGTIRDYKKDDSYDLRLFNSPRELQDAIIQKNKDQDKGISRLVATYDWQYSSQSKPEDKKYWEVSIGNWSSPWNRELSKDRKYSNLSWVEQPQTINEVGSIFTVQGFDLNYVGVIIGPSVKYRDGKIIYDIKESKNKNAVQNRKLSDGSMMNFGETLLRNELNVLITRGVNGLYLFAVDSELQDALNNAINHTEE